MSALQDRLESEKRAKQCGSKRKYETKALAKHGLKKMIKSHGQARSIYDIYECPWCTFWHVGHKQRKR